MTDLTDDLVAAAAAERARQAETAPDLAEAHQRAQEAAQEAEAAAAALQQARVDAHPARAASAVMAKAMREIGAALDAARAEAIDQVATGDLAGWVRYRLTCARLTGEWAALAAWFAHQTGGATAPPGPIAHRVPPLPAAPGQAEQPNAEGLVAFVELAVRQATEDARAAAQLEANARWWALSTTTKEDTPS